MMIRLIPSLAVLCLAFAPSPAGAQTDSLSSDFRRALANVAAAGQITRLDSSTLAPGVRREVRIYTGFGIGIPHRIMRVWQDSAGAHGVFGVFWRATLPSGMDAASVRQYETTMRAVVDTSFDCNRIFRSAAMNVCWLPARPDREDWTRILLQLDRLGIDSLPSSTPLLRGRDGWTVVLEVRTRAGYRAVSYWMPSTSASSPGERAAAGVAQVLSEAFARQLDARPN